MVSFLRLICWNITRKQSYFLKLVCEIYLWNPLLLEYFTKVICSKISSKSRSTETFLGIIWWIIPKYRQLNQNSSTGRAPRNRSGSPRFKFRSRFEFFSWIQTVILQGTNYRFVFTFQFNLKNPIYVNWLYNLIARENQLYGSRNPISPFINMNNMPFVLHNSLKGLTFE